MKSDQFINETTSGSVASVSMPLGVTQKRAKESVEVKGLKPVDKLAKAKKKGPYANSIVEGIETKKVSEAELQEDDLIIIPGNSKKRKTGFVPKGQSRVDHEVEMARSDLVAAFKNAKAIYQILKDRSEEEGIEGWVQEKLIKANDYLNAVKEYYDEKMMQEMSGGVIAAGGVGESWRDDKFADNDLLRGPSMMPKYKYNFKAPEPKSREELLSRLKELEAEFDPAYQQSDDYGFWSKQNKIQSEIISIKRQLEKQGVAEGYWADALKKAEADRESRKGKPFEKNPASHDKDGVYQGDKDLAGNPVPKKKQGVAEGSLNEFSSDSEDDGYYKEYLRGYKDGKGYPEVVKSSKKREIWMTVTPKNPPLTEPYMRGWYDGKYGPAPGKDLIDLNKLSEQGMAEGKMFASKKYSYDIDGTKVKVSALYDLYGQKVVGNKVSTKNFATPQDALDWVKNRIKKENTNEGVAEDEKQEWEVSFEYGPHQSDSVNVKASSKEEAISKAKEQAKKTFRTQSLSLNWARPVKKGVAEGSFSPQEYGKQLQHKINQDAISKALVLKQQKQNLGNKIIADIVKQQIAKKGEAEGLGPQKGDPVYYGSRLVGWFLGYSKYGKVITKPNYEEMGDEYANRDVYWDKDAVTIKSDKQGVAEGAGEQKYMAVYNKHIGIPSYVGKPITSDGKVIYVTASSKEEASSKFVEIFNRAQVLSSFIGRFVVVPKDAGGEQGVAEGLGDVVKGIKRKVAGKEDPKEVEHTYGRMARSAIDHKTPDQAEKDIKRWEKVNKVVNKEGVAEEIKGWKHAGRDLAQHRASLGKDVHLVSLKKDGTESKMNDAKKSFRSEDEARQYHERIKKLNPTRNIRHNLYVGDNVEKLD